MPYSVCCSRDYLAHYIFTLREGLLHLSFWPLPSRHVLVCHQNQIINSEVWLRTISVTLASASTRFHLVLMEFPLCFSYFRQWQRGWTELQFYLWACASFSPWFWKCKFVVNKYRPHDLTSQPIPFRTALKQGTPKSFLHDSCSSRNLHSYRSFVAV